MDIVVCVRQVPNPDLQYRIRGDGQDVVRDHLTYQANGPDEYALEEAVRIKEAHGGTVTALAAGPERVQEVLRQAMAKGADEALWVQLPEGQEHDPAVVAHALATALEGRAHDLVFCGVQSDDFAHGATGPMLASHLGLPHASVVTRVSVDDGRVEVHRELEGGVEERVALPLPSLLTIQFGINEPRYAAVAAILKATRQPIEAVEGAADAATRLQVRRMFIPEDTEGAEMLEGSPEETAQRLASILRERGLVPEG